MSDARGSWRGRLASARLGVRRVSFVRAKVVLASLTFVLLVRVFVYSMAYGALVSECDAVRQVLFVFFYILYGNDRDVVCYSVGDEHRRAPLLKVMNMV